MTRPSSGTALVLAPTGRDAESIGGVLAEINIAVRPCRDLVALIEAITSEVTLAILAEEGFGDELDRLITALADQAPWSDLPIVVLSAAARRASHAERWRLFDALGNVTILERPLPKGTLQSAVRAATRARQRQYATRAHLVQLRQANEMLESRVEDRTRELRNEIAERRTIQEALTHAQKLEAIGRLTGGVAHDFNNLLQVILGGASILERKGDNAAQRAQIVGAIRRAAQRGSALTQQMLAFARRQPLSVQTIDVAATVAAIEAVLRPSLPPSIELSLEFAADLWKVDADVSQLEVALLNLCINARDAIQVSGRIRIAARNVSKIIASGSPAAESVVIEVSDSGVGMDEATRGRAFDPFFTTKDVGRGTGLGLSQVYGFARQSHGDAEIRSAPGEGTTVSVFLPRSQKTAVSQSNSIPAAVVSQGRGRVLIVEDEAPVAELAKDFLQDMGYEAVHVFTADEALQLSLDGFVAVFSDVIMPGSLSGIQLAEEIRRRQPGLPILLTSGYTGAQEPASALKFPLLVKPYEFAQLAAALSGAIAAQKASPE